MLFASSLRGGPHFPRKLTPLSSSLLPLAFSISIFFPFLFFAPSRRPAAVSIPLTPKQRPGPAEIRRQLFPKLKEASKTFLGLDQSRTRKREARRILAVEYYLLVVVVPAMIGGRAQSQPASSSCSSSSSSSSPSSSSSGRGGRRRPDILNILLSAACLNSSSSDTGRGRSKLSSNKVTHGFHLVEGRSGHDMEDYHVAEYKYENNHELGLFAIYDGHLGDSVPSYLKANLFNNILKEPLFWTNPQEAIKNAYSSTNKYILENSKQLGPGGSTAVTAIVVDGRDMWIANIGDSRAVVCERGVANQLTVDHEPHTTNERKRIEKQGGFVSIFPGDVPRVNGQLAVARAFGDQSLKAHLSSEPDVNHVPINSNIEFVILASDGLWKVINNQEAVDLVKSIKDPQAAAKRLTSEALSRMSKDDISCIVIRFRC